jgi:hypothetical protein
LCRLDGADVLFIVAAEQRHHGHQEFAGKDRQCHAIVRQLRRLVRALEAEFANW